MFKRFLFSIIIFLVIGIFGVALYFRQKLHSSSNFSDKIFVQNEGGLIDQEHPLSIEYMRRQEYPGSDITIEQKLEPGSNFQRYLAAYKSDGLKIFALLTIPNGDPPADGWPAIVFNHGYISPDQYRTTERYVAYVDTFARNGYVVFKIDYRGHGNSEGEAVGGYGSPAYTIDALNAFSSLQKFTDVNPNKIGFWGHSMGGSVTLRAMVINPNIKAGVIWSGVVGSYEELLNNWRRNRPQTTPAPWRRSSWRTTLQELYGTPEENKAFWDSISPSSYLANISGPLQLHHATGDQSVPVEFSKKLYERMQEAGKEAELFIYQGDDHNISQNFSAAAQRSVEFFDRYLK